MKTATIEAKIQKDKHLLKDIQKVSYYDIERFIQDAQRYIKAIKEKRMVCIIQSVSNSGMSRTIRFLAPEKNKNIKEFQYLNFYAFFLALGYTPVKHDGFRIGGCGMDMIFHTNYSIIGRLKGLGMLTKEQASKLAQMTPTVL